MTHVTNDNEALRRVRQASGPDPHGLAAILLVESLLHALIARSVVTAADAIEIINIALDVKIEIAADQADGRRVMDESLALLSAIRQSISYDVA